MSKAEVIQRQIDAIEERISMMQSTRDTLRNRIKHRQAQLKELRRTRDKLKIAEDADRVGMRGAFDDGRG